MDALITHSEPILTDPENPLEQLEQGLLSELNLLEAGWPGTLPVFEEQAPTFPLDFAHSLKCFISSFSHRGNFSGSSLDSGSGHSDRDTTEGLDDGSSGEGKSDNKK